VHAIVVFCAGIVGEENTHPLILLLARSQNPPAGNFKLVATACFEVLHPTPWIYRQKYNRPSTKLRRQDIQSCLALADRYATFDEGRPSPRGGSRGDGHIVLLPAKVVANQNRFVECCGLGKNSLAGLQELVVTRDSPVVIGDCNRKKIPACATPGPEKRHKQN
jgi:hypothetical protein